MRLKKMTVVWLEGENACKSGIKLFKSQNITDPIKILKFLMKKEKYADTNWLIVRLMTYRERVAYAVFAAEQVIGYYEKKYPDCDAPRNAINAARKCIKAPSKKNKAAAAAAVYAVYAAAAGTDYAAYAGAAAAYAGASGASCAAYAGASCAAYAGGAASYAGASCASYAAGAYAAATAAAAVYVKILKYGIKLLEGGK